jgi:thiamine biosynthesis lipoprotein
MFHFVFLTYFSLFTPFISLFPKELDNKTYEISGLAQGTTYSIKYIYANAMVNKNAIDSIFDLMDYNFSLYKTYSLINSFNKVPRSVQLTDHFRTLIRNANFVSAATAGAFDITTLPLSILWGKFTTGTILAPNNTQIETALAYSGYQNIYIKGDSLFKKQPLLKIDADGIAQGYTVDIISAYLCSLGIKDFLVEVGGEIRTKGINNSKQPWVVGFIGASDYNSDGATSSRLALSGMSVSTSGRLSKFTNTNIGKKSHIIDPRTGKTVENNIISVTVLSPKCVLTDAFDNGMMVLGLDSAFKLCSNFPDMGLHIVYTSDSGDIRDTANAFFKKHILKPETGSF